MFVQTSSEVSVTVFQFLNQQCTVYRITQRQLTTPDNTNLLKISMMSANVIIVNNCQMLFKCTADLFITAIFRK